MAGIRAFIAFKLPEEIIAHIRRVQDGIRPYGLRVSWVKPENIHLTLKFLGDIRPEDVDRIGDAMTGAAEGESSMSLKAGGIGVFPGVRQPRVLWIGLKGETGRLIAFQKKLETGLVPLGFERESRLFKAHLTLARVKGEIDARQLVEIIEKFGSLDSEVFQTREMILYKSDLKPSGAVYTRLKTLNVKG
jgi:2'-5' RNA ligase